MIEKTDAFKGCEIHNNGNRNRYDPNCGYCVTTTLTHVIDYINALETETRKGFEGIAKTFKDMVKLNKKRNRIR